MSTEVDEIGRIFQTGSETWEWEIYDFSSLPKKTGVWYWSPVFHLYHSRWRLRIFPNGISNVLPAVHLRLVRWDAGTVKTVHCTLGIQKANGKEVTLPTQLGKTRWWQSPSAIWEFYKSEFKEREFLSSDILTFNLHMRMEGEAASKGFYVHEDLEPEVQTESDNDEVQTKRDDDMPVKFEVLPPLSATSWKGWCPERLRTETSPAALQLPPSIPTSSHSTQHTETDIPLNISHSTQHTETDMTPNISHFTQHTETNETPYISQHRPYSPINTNMHTTQPEKEKTTKSSCIRPIVRNEQHLFWEQKRKFLELARDLTLADEARKVAKESRKKDEHKTKQELFELERKERMLHLEVLELKKKEMEKRIEILHSYKPS